MYPSTHRRLAAVTGASSGIGYELAKIFAENGYDLIIVSNSDRIHEAAASLKMANTDVRGVQADLATFDGVETFYSEIQDAGSPLDAIAINAGVGVSGDFARDTDLRDELNMIHLNLVGPVHLTKRVLPQMIARGEGRILYTSSIAGAMPAPFLAVYGATKAFLTSFGQAIRNELRDTRVTVTVLMPGPTETNFFHRAGMEDTKLAVSEKDDAAEVAREGFDALLEGKDHVVAGSAKNTLQATAGHLLPDTVVAEMHRKQAEPGSANR